MFSHHPRDIRLSTYSVHRLWETCHPFEHLHLLASSSAMGIRTAFSAAESADAYQGSARLYDHRALQAFDLVAVAVAVAAAVDVEVDFAESCIAVAVSIYAPHLG